MKHNNIMIVILTTLLLINAIVIISNKIKTDTMIEQDNIYSATATINNVDNDTITVEDNKGYLWEFYSTDTYTVGSKCIVVFNNNNTIDRMDDGIIAVNYLSEVAQ